MGLKGQSARFGEDMNPLLLPRFEAPIVGSPSRIVFTTPTELTRFPCALLFPIHPADLVR